MLPMVPMLLPPESLIFSGDAQIVGLRLRGNDAPCYSAMLMLVYAVPALQSS
jgi:hypothetical protein